MRAGRRQAADRDGRRASRVPLGMAMPEAMVVGLAERARRRLRPVGGRTRSPSLPSDADAVVAGPGHDRQCRVARRLADALLRAAASRSRSTRRCSTPCPLDDEAARGARSRRSCCRMPARWRACSTATRRRSSADPLGCGRRCAERYRRDRAGQGRRQPCRRTPTAAPGNIAAARPGLGVSGSGDSSPGSSAACSRAAPSR